MASDLVNREQLAELIKRERPDVGDLTDDPYTDIITESASQIVRDTAGRPHWGVDPLEGEEVAAPPRARIIALWLAKRAWLDTGNLQRRTAGPISDTFFENGIRGLNLEAAELDWLESQRPGGNSGLWMLRHHRASGHRRPHYGDETPDGYSFLAGDMNFSHGLDMTGGPQDADSW
jgi:hypothetical protein